MPYLIRFLLCHALIGFAIALGFVAALIGLDVGGIGHLIGHSEHGLLFATVFAISVGLNFAGAQICFAVMLLPDDDDSGPGPGRPSLVRQRARMSDWFDRR